MLSIGMCCAWAALTPTVLGEAAQGDRPRTRGVVNIINFIRAVEPREPTDLLEPVARQIDLIRKHNLPATFLLQYDALIDGRFVDLLKRELRDIDEVGAWLEVVQPQVEAAGLEWRGRFPWDWHTDVGFTVGYTPEQREKLIDVYMERFRRTFGHYPRSVGCWLIDAHTFNYLADKYGIVAACICKDQVGTDGYTLWGGYWNQAYYPSRLNAFMPAQTPAQQVSVPVFRMLGSDPIYQYEHGFGMEAQGVVSLEPVYPQAGGSPEWVRWFFDVNFDAPCLAFAYTQVGQENSFGWPAMARGLTDQVELLAEWSRAGRVRVETLQASGEWFRRTFAQTPATAITALKDWNDENRRSIWYNSRFYRMNLFAQDGAWRIRDIHLFDERYAERYLQRRVTTHACTYDTLPVLDGFNWSTHEQMAGMRPVLFDGGGERRPLADGDPDVRAKVEEAGPETLLVTLPVREDGHLIIRCEPASLSFRVAGAVPRTWGLEMSWSKDKPVPIVGGSARGIEYRHNGFDYALHCQVGTVAADPAGNVMTIAAQDGEIVFEMGR